MSTTSSKPRQSSSKSNNGGRRKKSNYKHVPHCEKPPQVVAKRNARERKRVQAVNQAFVRLGKAIPLENKVRIKDAQWDQENVHFILFLFREGNESVKLKSCKKPLITSRISIIWFWIMMDCLTSTLTMIIRMIRRSLLFKGGILCFFYSI